VTDIILARPGRQRCSKGIQRPHVLPEVVRRVGRAASEPVIELALREDQHHALLVAGLAKPPHDQVYALAGYRPEIEEVMGTRIAAPAV